MKPPVEAPLPKVTAMAVVLSHGGIRESKPVQMFDKLPGWWNRAHQEQRNLWLIEYFRRALVLQAGDQLLSVTCNG